ncbi:MAG: hypothetical protein KDA85_22725, partial [Planctomycetaceae bacterium]|nr:hypothetical protein [Planctomycetaceae bacterium]
VVNAVARHKAVFQTGSQQRSDIRFRRAAELARNGLLGKIQRVEVGLPPGYDKPQGDTTVVPIPDHLNYDRWCGPAPVLPYMQARHHRWWRGHRAYGGGVLMDWIGHHNDIAHWAIGAERSGPVSVEAVDWKFPETDVYNTPQEYTIRCEYAGGIESTISTRNREGLRIEGTEGWVWVTRGRMEVSDPRWTKSDFVPGSIQVYRSDDHTQNFLECVRSRQECIAPAEIGHRSITPGHLGYVAWQQQKKLVWDAAAETISGDDQANALLQQLSWREPWKLKTDA